VVRTSSWVVLLVQPYQLDRLQSPLAEEICFEDFFFFKKKGGGGEV
jgi:hypothetical protein